MTKSKGQRLLQELIEKYGDAVIAFSYDYYATRIYTNPQNLRETKNPEDAVISEIHLSGVGEVTSWDDIKKLEDIATGRRPKMRYPVVVQESKDLYDSNQQQLLRKKHSQEFGAFMGSMMHPYAYPFHKVEEMFQLSKKVDHMCHGDVKDFGMAMDNYKKRK